MTNGENDFVPSPIKPTGSLNVLATLDIRVGTILQITDVAGSDRLVRLTVDFGDHERTIVAGLRQERDDPREMEGGQELFVVM